MTQSINRKRLFVGCIMSLVATAFGFAVRGAILENWRTEFNLTQEQIGYLQGAGLFPFAISIILFSLIIDRLGNGVSMAIAFTLHVLSAVITLAAPMMLADPGASPEAILAGQKTGYTLAVCRDVHLRARQRHCRSGGESGDRDAVFPREDALLQHPARRLAGRTGARRTARHRRQLRRSGERSRAGSGNGRWAWCCCRPSRTV